MLNNKGHFSINIVPFVWAALVIVGAGWCGLSWLIWFLVRLLIRG
jgi:hypothetical protein